MMSNEQPEALRLAEWIESDMTCEGDVQVAAELRRLHAELQAHRDAAPLCDKHRPSGGKRAVCPICALQSLSHALSRISYLCSEPNEMECGPYDVHCDEGAVVKQVEAMRAENESLKAQLALAAEHREELRKRAQDAALLALTRDGECEALIDAITKIHREFIPDSKKLYSPPDDVLDRIRGVAAQALGKD